MRIAIIGAGFAGLATAWHLLQRTQSSIALDIFDPTPMGQGVSGLSGGLFHNFVGPEARPLIGAEEKLRLAHRLLMEASAQVGQSTILSKGVVRLALDREQATLFQTRAKEYPTDLVFWSRQHCEATISGLKLPLEGGGLFIKEGLALNVPLYIEGLWQAVAKLGTTHIAQPFTGDQKVLVRYDKVVYAMGASIVTFAGLKQLPIQPVKGQMLILKWPQTLNPLPHALIGNSYLTMLPGGRAMAGATFERNFQNPQADLQVAKPLILEKLTPFFPSAAAMEIIDCRAGIRATTPSHMPLLCKLSNKEWVITGLGAKGLLYHSWLGDILASALLKDDPSLIPSELQLRR